MNPDFEAVLPIITGCSGLIGSSLVNKFISIETNCIGIDLIKNEIHSKFFTFCRGEFTSENFLHKLEEHLKNNESIETLSVMHLAGIDSKHGSNDNNTFGLVGDDIEENFDSMIDINLKQVVFFSKSLIKICNSYKKKLNLILTPSLYSFVAPDPLIYNNFEENLIKKQKSISYVVSKSSLPSITRYLTSTYAYQNHRFNCFVPHGVINSPSPLFAKNFIKKSPVRRLPKTNEIVAPCLFLLSNDSSYMNGQSLIIDGGWSCI